MVKAWACQHKGVSGATFRRSAYQDDSGFEIPLKGVDEQVCDKYFRALLCWYFHSGKASLIVPMYLTTDNGKGKRIGTIRS